MQLLTEEIEDMTNRIERLEAFEDRLGVSLEGLFATVKKYSGSKYFLQVNGELHPRENTKLKQDIDVILTAYDSTGRVIGTTAKWFKARSFFGFEVFSLRVQIPETPVAKVRIYPKAL